MLKIYNTATKEKEDFKPINPKQVTMYNCGPTVYDYVTIGNLRAYTMADTIRRSLEFLGYNVKQAMNFTDVGHLTFTDEQKLKLTNKELSDSDAGLDRMEKAAKKLNKTVWEVAEFYIEAAKKDFERMNYMEPSVRPRATEHIEEQIEMIKGLIDKGYAYITPSAIYFDTSKIPSYGSLTGQNLNEKKTGVREEVEVDPNKRNPHDFRLWQLDQHDHAMQWKSPWGTGFPGWHIECSAMSRKHLGDTIDIHTGGTDNLPVHHVNEIAQSESFSGKHFVNYWYHNEMLLVDGGKMGKSLGNAYTLNELIAKGYEPLDLRYFYLTANFRVQQNFSLEALDGAKSARRKLTQIVVDLKSKIQEVLEVNKESKWYGEYKKAIEDSFNMPQALSIVWQMIDDKEIKEEEKLSLLLHFDKTLGLKLDQTKPEEEVDDTTREKLEKIISERVLAKENKDFTLADQLRNAAKELGYELLDSKEGTTWKKI